MPLYDYVCTNCGSRVEVMHSVHGHGPAKCGACGGSMRKAVSAPAVHFKGTGWARKERSGTPKSPSPARESENSDKGAGSAAPKPDPS